MTAAHQPGGEVVPLRPASVATSPPDHLAELSPAAGGELAPAGWLAGWQDRPILASRDEWARQLRWRARASARLAAWCVTHPHLVVLREARPILRGLADMAVAWRHWQRCGTDQDRIDAMDDRNKAAALSEKLRPNRARRWWASVAGLAVLGGFGVWGWAVYGWALPALALVVVCVVADVLGRRARPVEDVVSPPPMPILVDDPDVPLSQLQAAILEVFEREGFAPGAVGVASPLAYDPVRMEYRLTVSCPDEIQPRHLRAVERGIGAADYAVRSLGTPQATNRTLVIRAGDPLVAVPQPSRLPSRSRSIADGLDLGVSSGDTDFVLPIAGLHVAVIGKTGSGKSKGALWAIIDRLSVCRDAVIWGIDLAHGPALPMWRDVIQKTAYNVEDAETLLDAVLAEIDRRMRVLAELAEDDDPSNDTDEWHPGLGPALAVVVDEFALLASYSGEKGRADLLGRTEVIVRTGRKVWVDLILGTQKSGNSDLGSTTMGSQIGAKVLLACEEGDTVRLLGTEARDAGWAPHHLRPSVEGDVRDAGKCYVDSPRHRTPDVYRFWAPLSVREVKDRARQRIADGLPTLDGGTTIDAVEVPAVLAFLERAFRDAKAAELPTSRLVGGAYRSAEALAEAARPYGVGPRKLTGGKARGYHLADVETAIGGLS